MSKLRYFWNILVTFTASGVWHGAGLTYLLWGFCHGVMVAFHRLVFGRKKKRHSFPVKFLCWLVTFVFVCMAWVLFRAQNMRDALAIFHNMTSYSDFGALLANRESQLYSCGLTGAELIAAMVSIVLLFGFEGKGEKVLLSSVKWIAPLRWLVLLLLLFICVIFGVYGANTVTQFIYFQF